VGVNLIDGWFLYTHCVNNVCKVHNFVCAKNDQMRQQKMLGSNTELDLFDTS
jgi:hypothetical protein